MSDKCHATHGNCYVHVHDIPYVNPTFSQFVITVISSVLDDFPWLSLLFKVKFLNGKIINNELNNDKSPPPTCTSACIRNYFINRSGGLTCRFFAMHIIAAHACTCIYVRMQYSAVQYSYHMYWDAMRKQNNPIQKSIQGITNRASPETASNDN